MSLVGKTGHLYQEGAEGQGVPVQTLLPCSVAGHVLVLVQPSLKWMPQHQGCSQAPVLLRKRVYSV